MRILKKKTAPPKPMTAELATIPPERPLESTTAPSNGLPVQSELLHVVIHRTFLDAKSVLIAGTFNGWKPSAADMKNCGRGSWQAHLMLKPGTYEYRFIVDEKWTDDPVSRNRIPNPFGGHNTVLIIGAPDEKSKTAGVPIAPISKQEPIPKQAMATEAKAG